MSSAGGEAVCLAVNGRLCQAYRAILQAPVAVASYRRAGVKTTCLVVGPIIIIVICRRQGHDLTRAYE
jgi:hypothetical protein